MRSRVRQQSVVESDLQLIHALVDRQAAGEADHFDVEINAADINNAAWTCE